jgi:hypothetical protein
VTLPDFHEAVLPGQHAKITSIITDFTPEALEQLRFWLEQNPPAVPIASVLGYSQIVPQRATVPTTESTTSLSFTDLATIGPALTGVPAGLYLIMVSGWLSVSASATATAQMVPAINGTALGPDAAALFTGATGRATVVGMTVQRLTLDNNTIGSKYRIDESGASGLFAYRNLVAIRMGN